MQEVIFDSERINFIKINESLVDEYLKMVNDPEVQETLGFTKITYSKEKELEWINFKLKENAIIFSMIEKDTNDYIGNIEIMNIKDNIGELGITITPTKQNNHFGQESIKRIIDYAFNDLKLDNLYLNVLDYNLKGIRCYEKSGFVRDGKETEEHSIHMTYKK